MLGGELQEFLQRPASSLQLNPGQTEIGGSVGGKSEKAGCLIPARLGTRSMLPCGGQAAGREDSRHEEDGSFRQ